MTRVLRDSDVRALVSFPEAVEAVAAGIVSAARSGAAARSTARFDSGWLRVVSGTLPDQDLLGFKAFHLVPGRGVRYLIALYRLSDGEPLALIDANFVTTARTSAAAAAAAATCLGDAPITLGIIGSGTLARDGLRALASVCNVRSARVFSPTAARRERYAAELAQELSIELTAVEGPANATDGADMVLCATQTEGAVALTARDAGRARYISSVSSTMPAQRELDERMLASAGLVVIDTPDAMVESGDLLAAAEAGLDESRVMLLADFLVREADAYDGRVVYKSIGSVEQDLALAGAIWRQAEGSGVGQQIETIEAPRL